MGSVGGRETPAAAGCGPAVTGVHGVDVGAVGLDRKRTRVIVLADLGHVQLKRGNTETALATWSAFLDCADGVQSVRINEGLMQLVRPAGTDRPT